MPITQTLAKQLTAQIRNMTGSKDLAETLLAMLAGDVTGWRDTRTTPIFKQAAPAAKTTSTTLTAAELLGGLITGNQGAAGAAAYTLPLATDLETALIAAYPGLATDDAFEFSVINISTVAAETITMTTNTGWTLVGDMILAANATGDESVGIFRARRTAANTYTLYRVG